MRKLYILGIALLAFGCKTFVVDPSMEAVYAQDLTLIISACENVPARGMDICRVKEGTSVASVWKLVVPVGGNFIGGELTVFYKDQSYTTAITEPVVNVPWASLVKSNTWSLDHDGEALALAVIRYKDDQGVEKIWRARGVAKLVVLRSGYDPASIDSAFTTWEGNVNCRVGYTTAGRSWIECKSK